MCPASGCVCMKCISCAACRVTWLTDEAAPVIWVGAVVYIYRTLSAVQVCSTIRQCDDCKSPHPLHLCSLCCLWPLVCRATLSVCAVLQRAAWMCLRTMWKPCHACRAWCATGVQIGTSRWRYCARPRLQGRASQRPASCWGAGRHRRRCGDCDECGGVNSIAVVLEMTLSKRGILEPIHGSCLQWRPWWCCCCVLRFSSLPATIRSVCQCAARPVLMPYPS